VPLFRFKTALSCFFIDLRTSTAFTALIPINVCLLNKLYKAKIRRFALFYSMDFPVWWSIQQLPVHCAMLTRVCLPMLTFRADGNGDHQSSLKSLAGSIALNPQ